MLWQLDCFNALTAWMKVECFDSLTALTAWLPQQLNCLDCLDSLNALTAWMLWQLDCLDSLTALTAWLPWQLECFDSLNALTAWIPNWLQTNQRTCWTVEMLSHLKKLAKTTFTKVRLGHLCTLLVCDKRRASGAAQQPQVQWVPCLVFYPWNHTNVCNVCSPLIVNILVCIFEC